MRRELTSQRKTIASAKSAQRDERRRVQMNLASKLLVPRQRRVPQEGNNRAVPAEARDIDNDRAAGCSAHAHDGFQ